MEHATLSPAEREAFLRTAWLSHDARWYSAAARTTGVETANKLNREAIREAGAIEARRLHRSMDFPPIRTATEFIEFAAEGKELVVGNLIELEMTPESDHSYRVAVTKCFASEQIAWAGLSASYECGIFDRIQGWHEGLGIPLTEDVPTTMCLLANGKPCERLLTFTAQRETVTRPPTPASQQRG